MLVIAEIISKKCSFACVMNGALTQVLQQKFLFLLLDMLEQRRAFSA